MIDYFQLEGVPGNYFKCRSYGTLSVAACSRNYVEAPTQSESGRLGGCLNCEVGQEHAITTKRIVVPSGAENRSKTVSHSFCVRCRRASSEEGLRLVGRMRLLRKKTICISCYNREREFKTGRNAKGTSPRKWASLMMIRLAVLNAGGGEILELDNLVYDRLEAVYTVLRNSSGAAVGWAPPTPFDLKGDAS